MTFIVAEIGVNWDGNFELAREMISNAKKSGCDAVKFQSFNEKIVASHPEKERLLKTSVLEHNIENIDSISKSVGIEWFSTPMFPESVEILEPYVKRFKLRSFDGDLLLKNKSSILFEKLLKTNKEIIISSQQNPANTEFYNHDQTKWLYVVPKYPCTLNDLDFSNMDAFDGYSNHCPHFLAPLTASILGANIIEIHITSDKSKNFFDNNVSFDYPELNHLVHLLRLSEKIKK